MSNTNENSTNPTPYNSSAVESDSTVDRISAFSRKGQTVNNVLTDWLKTTQGLMTSFVAVLVVLPSMINAFADIYVALFNIPRTLGERNNQELFQKHFQVQPVHIATSLVKPKNGEPLMMKINIYEDGDLFIEYGQYSQWFPFKQPEQATAFLNLFNNVYAQELNALNTVPASPCELQRTLDKVVTDNSGTPAESVPAPATASHAFIQKDEKDGNTLKRERLYDDGCKETLLIDMKTGNITKRSSEYVPVSAEDRKKLQQQQGVVPIQSPTVIDIQQLQQKLAPSDNH